jgi:L-rhamnose-H+ transport protein
VGETVWRGLTLAMAAGVTAGNCMLPMQFARRWKWENTWLVFSCASLLLIPCSLALLFMKDLPAVYAGISVSGFAVPMLFGAGWGVGQVLFGLTIARLGLALGYAIVMGLVAVSGTLVPLFALRREAFESSRGLLVLCGATVMVAGVIVSGLAGRLREHAARPERGRHPQVGSYGCALLLAIACGLLSPMLNYSFAFAQQITRAAVRLGHSPAASTCAIWPVSLAGGFVPNVAYCVYLLRRDRSWPLFRMGWPDAHLALLMSALWMG